MSVRLWLANGLILGGMTWMATLGGMEVRASRILPDANGANDATTRSPS